MSFTRISCTVFDSVHYPLLAAKLKQYGVNGSLVDWLSSYLSDTHIIVNISSSLSPPFTDAASVPQGSILGPMLFTIFINNIIFSIPDYRIVCRRPEDFCFSF